MKKVLSFLVCLLNISLLLAKESNVKEDANSFCNSPVVNSELNLLTKPDSILNDKKIPYITKIEWQKIFSQSAFTSLSEDSSKNLFRGPENIYDMLAKQIAGLYMPESFSKSDVFIDYVTFVTNRWNRLNSISLSKIDRWAAQYISPYIDDIDTVFYPFGGPDAAYALKFFPNATCYILVGLESIGDIRQINKSLKKESTLIALKEALSSYLTNGYFITSEMMTNLHQEGFRGTLQLILLELARFGAIIDNVVNYSINQEGAMTKRDKQFLDCVCIGFYYQGKKRYLYYVRANLANENVKIYNLFNFVKRFKFITFVKSASYALHDRNFTRLSDFILHHTNAILQDDTGIPFYLFDNRIWRKKLFGKYTEPTLKVFKLYKQTALTRYYETHQVQDIPFKIGYGFNRNRPNLLLAIKREDIKDVFNSKNKINSSHVKYSLK